MKFTSTLFVSAFGLSAMPLSLALELPRRLLSTYDNGGGTAVDYVSKNNHDDFVLGTVNTNNCPPEYSHITDRTRCQAAYYSLAVDHPELSNHVDVVYNWPSGRWPTGCFINRNGNGVYFNKSVGGNDAGNGQPVCEIYKQYVIQQTCQRLHPGHNVVAIPVSNGPSTQNCNDYYKSTSSENIDFSDNNAPPGWTCCVERVSQSLGYVFGPVGSNDCPKGTFHLGDQDECAAILDDLHMTSKDIHGPLYVHDFGTGRPAGCSIFRRKGSSDYGALQFNTNVWGGHGYSEDEPICFPPVSNSNTATPMLSLVGSSNEIPQASNMPSSGLLGLIVGLAMVVATYKVVKDHRRHHHHPHHPHLKQDNKPDYESLMQA